MSTDVFSIIVFDFDKKRQKITKNYQVNNKQITEKVNKCFSEITRANYRNSNDKEKYKIYYYIKRTSRSFFVFWELNFNHS